MLPMHMHACMFSHVWLCDSTDCSLPGSSGILQAIILEWVAFPFSRGSLQPIDWTPGLNPGLLHCRQILYCLSHKGNPKYVVRKGWIHMVLQQKLHYSRNLLGSSLYFFCQILLYICLKLTIWFSLGSLVSMNKWYFSFSTSVCELLSFCLLNRD